MTLKFTNTSNIALDNGIKLAVYGRSGVGKTRLLATAPKPLIISAEKGLLSLNGENIPVIEVTSLEELEEAYEFVKSSPHMKGIKTVCLDSASEIAEKVLNDVKPHFKDGRQAFYELLERMLEIMRLFRDLEGLNVVFVFKQERMKDEATQRMLYAPMMPGQKLSQQIPYIFDLVLCLREGKDENKEIYTYLQTTLDSQYEAKDRSGKLDEVEPPDLGYIFDKILGDTNG